MDEEKNLTSIELSEQLFKAIDAIVTKRLQDFPCDKFVEAEITNDTNKNKGEYIVTTDNNITFIAFSDRTDLFNGVRLYVRIPKGDYTKRKVISELYEPLDIQKLQLIDLNDFPKLQELKTYIKQNLIQMQIANSIAEKNVYEVQISDAIKEAEDYLKENLSFENAEQVIANWLNENSVYAQKFLDQAATKALRTLKSTKSKYKTERYFKEKRNE